MSGLVTDPNAIAYTEMIEALHRTWKAHVGQEKAIEQVFRLGKNKIFIQCGRKWGKTEFALYVLWRIAYSFPGSPCYFIAPEQKQAREIVWAKPRMKTFGPREWLLDGDRGISESEMRLRFKNGSFIKVDGSDNYDSYRGPEFKVNIYEEFKDHNPKFRAAMRPNAAVLDGIEVFIGTPPEEVDDEDEEHEFIKTKLEVKSSPRGYYYEAPTWENPGITQSWLDEEKRLLYARGEGDKWEREYGAKLIKGGNTLIFPMLGKRFIRPHEEILREIKYDLKKLEWYVWTDPASASCFAVLFIAINPYNKKQYVLGEIYETNQKEMSVGKISPRIIEMRDGLWQGEWRQGYDEAATWFFNEMMDLHPKEDGWEPSQKAKNKKEDGLSLCKDIMLRDLLVISDQCPKFFEELKKYKKGDNGKILKKDDHLIDCWRYINGAACYELNEEKEPVPEKELPKRGYRIEDDFPQDDDAADYGMADEEDYDW